MSRPPLNSLMPGLRHGITAEVKDPYGYIAKTRFYELWLKSLSSDDRARLTPPAHYSFLHAHPILFKDCRVPFEVWYAVKRLTR